MNEQTPKVTTSGVYFIFLVSYLMNLLMINFPTCAIVHPITAPAAAPTMMSPR